MLGWHQTTAFLILASSFACAQLTIENPKHIDISDQRAQLIFLTTLRVVESEFHSAGSLENKFRLRLVLGQAAERFTIDDPLGNGSVYMERWNEGKFAVVAMRLADFPPVAPLTQQPVISA